MFQVTFHDLFPTTDVMAQVSAAHAALRSKADRGDEGACLSVTLTHRGDEDATPYRVLIELVGDQGSCITAATEAYDPHAALRSGLSVTDHKPLRVARVEVNQHRGEPVANDYAPRYGQLPDSSVA